MLDRTDRERIFHDERFRDGGNRETVDSFYDIAVKSQDRYRDLLHANARGKRVLEYGCGEGHATFEIAPESASVTGIDISPVAIETVTELARSQGLDNTTFAVMDAEATQLADRSFDFICGSGILHHLDLSRALPEVARMLSADGTAVFMEPMGHNPLINAFRKATPGLRTADEHPLVMADFKLAERYFGAVELEFFHLHTLLAIPLRKQRFAKSLVPFLDAIDAGLFRALPGMRRYAWVTILQLRQPR